MLNAIVNQISPKRRAAEDIDKDLAEPIAGLAGLDAEYAAACLDAADGVSGAEDRKRKILQQKDNLSRRVQDLQMALQGARAREQAEAATLAATKAKDERDRVQRIVRAAIDARQRDAARLFATLDPFVKAYRALHDRNGETFAALNAGYSNSGIDLDGSLLRWDVVVSLIRGELFRQGLDWDAERFRSADVVPEFLPRFTAATELLRKHAGLDVQEG